jgi:NAD(P) transhydrogenase
MKGKKLWPPPKISDPSPPAAKAATAAVKKEELPRNYFQETLRDSLMYTSGLATLTG